VAALGPGGEMLGVEIKVALADLRGDNKCRNIWIIAICSILPSRPIFRPTCASGNRIDRSRSLWWRHRQGGRSAIAASQPPQSVTISFAKVAAERLSAILETIAETSSPNL